MLYPSTPLGQGPFSDPLYITGHFAGFTYVLLPKACKILREIANTFAVWAAGAAALAHIT